jgi:hypothetical protein
MIGVDKVIGTAKELALMIQKLDNLDLLKRMVELQEQVYELVLQNRDVKDENRLLSEKLATREQMEFRKNAYWRSDEGPFCPRCFDTQTLVVRMLSSKGFAPQCPECKTCAVDPDREPSKPVRRGASPYLSRGGY